MSCKYRELYRHDGGNYYQCKGGIKSQFDCEDSYSDFYECTWVQDINTPTTNPLMKEMAEALQQMADLYYGRDNQPIAGTYARKMDAVLQKYREQKVSK